MLWELHLVVDWVIAGIPFLRLNFIASCHLCWCRTRTYRRRYVFLSVDRVLNDQLTVHPHLGPAHGLGTVRLWRRREHLPQRRDCVSTQGSLWSHTHTHAHVHRFPDPISSVFRLITTAPSLKTWSCVLPGRSRSLWPQWPRSTRSVTS